MVTFLWLMLLFPGVCDLSSSVPRQFHVVKEEKTWAEAQQYCRKRFTDLATIDDMTEMEKLTRIIQEEGVTEAWIGLTYGSSPKWQWSLADRDFYGENETEFRNWASGQPGGAVGDCVRSSGQWYDYPCTAICNFVCYNGRNSSHPFVLIEDGESWAEAQRYCRENHTDLASVRNQAENDQIEAVRGPGGTSAWIGLFNDREWEWSDGSNSSFRQWGPGEPNNGLGNEFCVSMWPSGLWNDVPCNERRSFICYGASKEKVKQIVRVQLPVTSDVNMEDPDVQEAFLQQIRQRLGLPANAKVSWRPQADGKVFHKEKKEVKKKQRRN